MNDRRKARTESVKRKTMEKRKKTMHNKPKNGESANETQAVGSTKIVIECTVAKSTKLVE